MKVNISKIRFREVRICLLRKIYNSFSNKKNKNDLEYLVSFKSLSLELIMHFGFRRKLFRLLFSFFLYSCGTTIEFLPEGDFQFKNPNYQKKSFEEVELTYQKPTKPFTICGEIFLRKFQNPIDLNEVEKKMKKEAFEYKLDGIWIRNSKKEPIPPILVLGKNQSGAILNYYELEKEVEKIQAIGFRYKENANQK